jgi:hypothetical protein
MELCPFDGSEGEGVFVKKMNELLEWADIPAQTFEQLMA